jgi:hypothetical protein
VIKRDILSEIHSDLVKNPDSVPESAETLFSDRTRRPPGKKDWKLPENLNKISLLVPFVVRSQGHFSI